MFVWVCDRFDRQWDPEHFLRTRVFCCCRCVLISVFNTSTRGCWCCNNDMLCWWAGGHQKIWLIHRWSRSYTTQKIIRNLSRRRCFHTVWSYWRKWNANWRRNDGTNRRSHRSIGTSMICGFVWRRGEEETSDSFVYTQTQKDFIIWNTEECKSVSVYIPFVHLERLVNFSWKFTFNTRLNEFWLKIHFI